MMWWWTKWATVRRCKVDSATDVELMLVVMLAVKSSNINPTSPSILTAKFWKILKVSYGKQILDGSLL